VISSLQAPGPTLHTMNSTEEHPCQARFEPEIPAIRRVKTCALDRTTTGIGRALISIQNVLVDLKK
jgi:hypothetical protein